MTDSHRSQLRVAQLPGQRGLQVIGDVDLSTRDIWRDALEAATPNAAPARLDLSRLSFIDARGTACWSPRRGTALFGTAHAHRPTGDPA